MSTPVLYHNPRCSKSRQALTFLNEQDIDVDIIEYLKQGLKPHEVSNVVKALLNSGQISQAHDLLRTKEPEYKLAGLSKESSEQEVIAAICEYPKLLERPILLVDQQAAIGRPLDNIANLVNG